MKCINHPDCISLSFSQPHAILSSAVLHGGLRQCQSLLNLKVDQYAKPPYEDPTLTLTRRAQQLQLPGPVSGMMTAAAMASLRHRCISRQQGEHDVVANAWVTCGLSNLLRAGDAVTTCEGEPERGTINIWLHCSQPLSDAAMAEALIVLTEAKTTAIRDARLKSRDSGLDASGTGTDSHAVLCPLTPKRISAQSSAENNATAPLRYCGKHTLMGEAIGVAVYQAVSESISACLEAVSAS